MLLCRETACILKTVAPALAALVRNPARSEWGELRGIEPGRLGVTLDQIGNGAPGQPLDADAGGLVYAAEKRAGGDPGGIDPGAQGLGGAKAQSGRNGDNIAGASLVGLRAAYGDAQPVRRLLECPRRSRPPARIGAAPRRSPAPVRRGHACQPKCGLGHGPTCRRGDRRSPAPCGRARCRPYCRCRPAHHGHGGCRPATHGPCSLPRAD